MSFFTFIETVLQVISSNVIASEEDALGGEADSHRQLDLDGRHRIDGGTLFGFVVVRCSLLFVVSRIVGKVTS